MYQTLSGNHKSVVNAKAKLAMNNRKVRELKYDVIKWNGDDDNYVIMVVEIEPYSLEEQLEIDTYGDPHHEDYLRSEQYDADHQSEKWSWLKNE